MNDEEVILNVGSTKFLLSVSEAMEVAKVLNSCQTIGSKWLKNGSVTCVQKPSNDVCFVTPMTGTSVWSSMQMNAQLKRRTRNDETYARLLSSP